MSPGVVVSTRRKNAMITQRLVTEINRENLSGSASPNALKPWIITNTKSTRTASVGRRPFVARILEIYEYPVSNELFHTVV
jgi:hypothetical protein